MITKIMEWFIDRVKYYPEEFKDKRILEVGSKNVNGSVRPIIVNFGMPKDYIGVDIEEGKHVDAIVSIERLVEGFGTESFDVVISTELVEHVRDWRAAMHNMKLVLKRTGALYLTAPSYGFGYHGYPFDFWRYEIEDMKVIFSDFIIQELVKTGVGIIMKAEKPVNYVEKSLENVALYSICIGKTTCKNPNLSYSRKLSLILQKVARALNNKISS